MTIRSVWHSFLDWLLPPYFIKTRYGRRQLRRPFCTHPRIKVQRWLADCGTTPMITQECPDCEFFDEGHVHADPSDWINV